MDSIFASKIGFKSDRQEQEATMMRCSCLKKIQSFELKDLLPLIPRFVVMAVAKEQKYRFVKRACAADTATGKVVEIAIDRKIIVDKPAVNIAADDVFDQHGRGSYLASAIVSE